MNTPLFGTDGIRARIGTSPFTLETLPHLAHAYAQWLSTRFPQVHSVGVANDTRQSAPFITSLIQSYVWAHGISTYNAGVLSTPALMQLVAAGSPVQAGIMISASHNAYHDNGLKFIGSDGQKLSHIHEAEITQLYHCTPLPEPAFHTFGTDHHWTSATSDYVHLVTTQFPQQFLSGLKIVLDCAQGATHQLAPTIFALLGAHTITINNVPTGTNINHQCGSLQPQSLQHQVRTHNADIGFAFDGDGDRVIAVNRHGIVKDGDDILALLAAHPQYHQEPTIVGTIMTNQGLSAHLAHLGKTLLRTPVGDSHILSALHTQELLLGGEPSGHILMRDHMHGADGIMTALKVVQAVIQTGNWNLETFTHFPQSLINLPVTYKKNLDDYPLSTIIQTHHSLLKQGRIIVRYSGTESLLRIMVEEQHHDDAQLICHTLAQALAKELS